MTAEGVKRVEEFDYPTGSRYWNRGLVGATGRTFRWGSPMEIRPSGQLACGRGPYNKGVITWPEDTTFAYAPETEFTLPALSLLTGWDAACASGISIAQLIGEDFDPVINGAAGRWTWRARLSPGSPGEHGTGIIRLDEAIDRSPIQVCWSQAGGVWVEAIPYPSTLATPVSKVTIPLATAGNIAAGLTLGVEMKLDAVDPMVTTRLWTFSINGSPVAYNVREDGTALGAFHSTTTPPDALTASELFVISAYVINPYPEEDFIPWGTRPHDFGVPGSPLPDPIVIAPALGAIYADDPALWFYPGETHPVFDWIDTWWGYPDPHSLPSAPRHTAPPLHQSRADSLAAGGAWRYTTARTRQASIWQGAPL